MFTNRTRSRAIRLSLIAILCLAYATFTSAWATADPLPRASTAATVVVTNLNDSGPGSLRDAIERANTDGSESAITFAAHLHGGSIQLQSPLPGLSENGTTIDGDINHDRKPDIELNGEGGSAGLEIQSSRNVIRGLAINRFAGHGIAIRGNRNRVEYCNIGTDLTGKQSLGNRDSGVSIRDGATGNQIGPGNVIAYNVMYPSPNGGVAVLDGAKQAYPEFIGLTPDYVGIFTVLDFPYTSGAFTSADGITPIDHSGHPFADTFGARFSGQLVVSTAGSYTFSIIQPDDNVRVVVDRTVIVEDHCCVQRVEVTVDLAAGEHAFQVDYLAGWGAAHLAVEITGPGTTSFSTDGQAGLRGEFFQLRIPTERNRITQNSIFDNGRIGIELDALEDGNGVNINDPGDGDLGPNTAINYPVLSSAQTTLGKLIVKGTIDTPNPRPITIEFFANPVPTPGGDPSGYGEGAIYLGSAKPNPQGKFTAPLPRVPAGTLISATATDADGNTSEFCKNIAAVRQP
jgi:hypothetical protein